MLDELDSILSQQLARARRNKRLVRKMRLLLGHDQNLSLGEMYIDGHIAFLESMVSDKSFLTRKHRPAKPRETDILARNAVYETYRQAVYVTFFGYKICVDSLGYYLSMFRRLKD